MCAKQVYKNNSGHKDLVRNKWVEFIQENIDHEEELRLITFPAGEMQDLQLFQENGLIEWEETETGAFNVTKGKIICFEKSHTIFALLSSKLVNVILLNEIGSYIALNYHKIISGESTTVFPVDAINLDYDVRLAKCSNKIKIDSKLKFIFEFQGLHKRNFSLFLTWPSTEEDDEHEYKELLKTTIANNLTDPSAITFKEKFEEEFVSVDDLDYDKFSLVGLIKVILKQASHNLFQLNKHEYYVYGEEGKKKMYSILLNFEYTPNKSTFLIYSEDVTKSLAEINDLTA